MRDDFICVYGVLTKGEHQFIVATHTDKQHIHSHIIFNSTTLDCERKFANSHQCGRDVAKISVRICREHGLSVVENPKQKGKSYKEWDERRKGQSWKGKLQETIDRVLPESRDFDDFLARMRSEGYDVKLGKNISFRALTDDDVKRLKAMLKRKSANQIRSSRCRILLCLDEEHLPAMTYDPCILSHNVSQTTIANTAKRFVPSGIDEVLKINKNIKSDNARREVDGRTEARIIDIACGPASSRRAGENRTGWRQ